MHVFKNKNKWLVRLLDFMLSKNEKNIALI